MISYMSGAARGVLRCLARFLRYGYTDAFGQILHRFHETQPLIFHQEADGGAMRPAAEAMVELLGGADGERRRFLAVKRAARHIVGA